MNGKLSIIIMSVILITAAILTVQSSSPSLSMLQSSYAQSCPEGAPVDASGNCPTDVPPPADDGETTQAPPPATTETPPPATEAPPPATTETPPPATEAPPPATTETPPPATEAPPPATTETPPPATETRLEGNTTGNSTYPVYCPSCNNDIYAGGGDFASMILAGHNRVRAQVGVAPLVWNDSLAASAQTWADHLAATGQFYHDPNSFVTWGENLAGISGGVDPNVPRAQM